MGGPKILGDDGTPHTWGSVADTRETRYSQLQPVEFCFVETVNDFRLANCTGWNINDDEPCRLVRRPPPPLATVLNRVQRGMYPWSVECWNVVVSNRLSSASAGNVSGCLGRALRRRQRRAFVSCTDERRTVPVRRLLPVRPVCPVHFEAVPRRAGVGFGTTGRK